MNIFALTRLRRIALTSIYLSTRPAAQRYGAGEAYAARYAMAMTREQMVAAIVATREGARLITAREAGT